MNFDQATEEKTHEERSWVRKRFAEIALHILAMDGDKDEASKADVVKLLTPRFIDQGAANVEQASARAERFLERQELQSGLLVSRRALSYRFVHLTFQEYLAAWQLSNLDFDKVIELIRPRLRLAKWFETLQLLGAQWAKESDDKVDRYVAWQLSELGVTITDQAPVVALCANIVKDICGVAELRPATRKAFSDAVKATLDAFRKGSGVPPKTQVEILEALGQLGAAVKSHLIDATKASLFQVRRRAIEMLLPHLSDDELFGMTHLLEDQSQEPIGTYLTALLVRDRNRATTFVSTLSLTGRIAGGISILPDSCLSIRDDLSRFLLTIRAVHADYFYRRWTAFQLLIDYWPDETTRELLSRRAVRDVDECPRRVALNRLAENWPDEATRELLRARAADDQDGRPRSVALQLLAKNWPDEATRELLRARAVEDQDEYVRIFALQLLPATWPDESTRDLIRARAVEDQDETVRSVALRLLPTTWPDESTRDLIRARAVEDQNQNVRGAACSILGGMLSHFGRILSTKNLDGTGPYLDHLQPLSTEHIEEAAAEAGIAVGDLEAQIASLNQHLGWDIRVGARPAAKAVPKKRRPKSK